MLPKKLKLSPVFALSFCLAAIGCSPEGEPVAKDVTPTEVAPVAGSAASTNDIRVVGHMSHEIGVMNAGRMVEQGAAAELLRHPAHAYSRALFDAAPGAGRLMRGAADVVETAQGQA